MAYFILFCARLESHLVQSFGSEQRHERHWSNGQHVTRAKESISLIVVIDCDCSCRSVIGCCCVARQMEGGSRNPPKKFSAILISVYEAAGLGGGAWFECQEILLWFVLIMSTSRISPQIPFHNLDISLA